MGLHPLLNRHSISTPRINLSPQLAKLVPCSAPTLVSQEAREIWHITPGDTESEDLATAAWRVVRDLTDIVELMLCEV